jgi:enoyl-CoA hydratase/carnithine racemase
VGLLSGDGGAWYLPRVVGEAKALEMALTCEPVHADAALACGLVSRIVPLEELMGETVALARRIAALPRQAVRYTKRLFHQSRTMDLTESLDLAASLQAVLQNTDEHRDAVAALINKAGKRPARV